MLSRIADSLFWLNRYMERSEGLLRVLHTNYILSFDRSLNAAHSWEPVMEIFSSAPPEKIKELAHDSNAALYYLINDAQNINSIKALTSKARENARGIQDNITKEVWESVNQLYHWLNDARFDQQLASADLLPVIDELLNRTILYVGITDTTMPRGIGWSFMCLGRFTERCLLTAQLTSKQFEQCNFDLAQEKDILYWRNLLLCLSGYEHHLKTYRSAATTENVVDQVILDTHFPRSIKYILNRMEKYLQDVVKSNATGEAESLYREFSRFNSLVQFADINYIKERGLKSFLNMVQQDVNRFSNQLGQIFFSYT